MHAHPCTRIIIAIIALTTVLLSCSQRQLDCHVSFFFKLAHEGCFGLSMGSIQLTISV